MPKIENLSIDVGNVCEVAAKVARLRGRDTTLPILKTIKGEQSRIERPQRLSCPATGRPIHVDTAIGENDFSTTVNCNGCRQTWYSGIRGLAPIRRTTGTSSDVTSESTGLRQIRQ